MPQPQDNLPGKGLMGWLGRQVGYVAKAVATEVPEPPTASATPAPPDSSVSSEPARTLYKQVQVVEGPHPADPDLTLRRTTIDEAIKK